ncbi:MAG: hypothetical protein ACK2U9_17655 [Anaerolineae bacterium]
MSRLTTAIPACLVGVLLAACGEPKPIDLPGEEISCDWFEENDNCWRTSLQSFSGSLPDQAEIGQLSADGKRCTYAGGYEVIFVNPIPVDDLGDSDGLRDFAWDLEARLGGDFLFAYREPDDASLVLETGRGTFLLEADRGAVVLTCPGGSQFNVPEASMLRTCPIETMPAKVTSWEAAGMTFVLRGTGGADLLLFDCQAP